MIHLVLIILLKTFTVHFTAFQWKRCFLLLSFGIEELDVNVHRNASWSVLLSFGIEELDVNVHRMRHDQWNCFCSQTIGSKIQSLMELLVQEYLYTAFCLSPQKYFILDIKVGRCVLSTWQRVDHTEQILIMRWLSRRVWVCVRVLFLS